MKGGRGEGGAGLGVEMLNKEFFINAGGGLMFLNYLHQKIITALFEGGLHILI